VKIISIQVGMPKEITFRGKKIVTGIFKQPVKGTVRVRTFNLDGDKQADLKVHGGRDKAVYAYSLDAYPWWKKARPDDVFEYGAFGENLCVDELPEDKTYIGDTFEVGTTILQISEPRFPCYKLGAKFGDPKILKTFMQSKRPGSYLRVLQEGTIKAGQKFKLISREKKLVSVLEVFESKKK